jgi:hypothetical protein
MQYGPVKINFRRNFGQRNLLWLLENGQECNKEKVRQYWKKTKPLQAKSFRPIKAQLSQEHRGHSYFNPQNRL